MSKSRQKNNKLQSQLQIAPKNTLIFFILAVFGFILYGNTISNDYALDDIYVITENKYTKEGIEGIGNLVSKHFFAGYFGDKEVMLAGGRYRPLSMVTFAVEFEMFGKNPHISHFFNVLLFILTGFCLYLVLKRLFPPGEKRSWYLGIPMVATIIFMAHPIHTEVVANIKGRDEILAFLGSLLTLQCVLKYLEKEKFQWLIYAFISFFLALMSKEIAATFLIIIPLTVYFFRSEKIAKYISILIPLTIATGLFIIIRQNVLSGLKTMPSTELLDNPFIQATVSQKYATIIYTLGLYLKLLLFPHPLTWDYYPYHIPLVNWMDIRTILPILIYLGMAATSLYFLKRKSMFSYVIIGFGIALAPVSNMFFPVGTFMAERFLYIPSFFYCLLLAWLLSEKLPLIIIRTKLLRNVSISAMVVVLLLLSIKTISRNTAWKDDFTLYSTDVKTSGNSARGNDIVGEWYAFLANKPENIGQKQEYFQKAYNHLNVAVKIHPTYQNALFQLGNLMYDYKKDIDSTFYYYCRVLKLDSNENNVMRNSDLILRSVTDTTQKRRLCLQLYQLNHARFEVIYNLATAYGFSNLDEAIPLMQKARELQPQNIEALKFLGSAYYTRKDYKNAAKFFEESIKIQPGDKPVLQDLYFTWLALNNKEKAAEYLKLAEDK